MQCLQVHFVFSLPNQKSIPSEFIQIFDTGTVGLMLHPVWPTEIWKSLRKFHSEWFCQKLLSYQNS